MNEVIKNLHTAIRRYCIDNYSRWAEKYNELVSAGKNLSGINYTDEAFFVFPRYMLLGAILVEVERYRPEEFATLDEAKDFLRLVTKEAQSVSTESLGNRIEQKAIAEERIALCKFIDDLTEKDLLSVEPLFYRRILSDKESDSVWRELSSRWKLSENYWYPLISEKPENVEAFQDFYFEKEVGSLKLQEILRSRNIEKVWELKESGTNYKMELSVLEPYYDGTEGFWCDKNFDWIIYASHESSITIGGWLLPEIQAVWSNWEDRVWTTPFFD